MQFKKSIMSIAITSAILGLSACNDSNKDNSNVTGKTLSSSTLTLTNDNVYALAAGFPGTYVGNGDANDGDSSNDDAMKLVVEPGTLILGRAQEALMITRGSTIEANGTAADPIVMTSRTQFDAWTNGGDGTSGRGEWAGFAMMGYAKTTQCPTSGACDVLAEGDIGAYGGADNADNSGKVEYVVVRHAGNDLDGNGNELNGFTLFGVGSGTTLNHIQVHKGFDDGIEHFGSSDFMSHIVLTDNGDDSFDWGFGYTGGAQFVVIKQADDKANNGIEADGNPVATAPDFTSMPTLANLTMMGPTTPAADSKAASGMLLRVGTGANIHNAVVAGFKKGCIDIDDVATMELAFDKNATPADYTGKLSIDNSIIECATNFIENDQDLDNADGDDDSKTGTDTFAALSLPTVPEWFAGSGINNDSTITVDVTSAGVPQNAFATSVQGKSFTAPTADFTSTDYAGAFDPNAANPNWTDGWTVGLNGNKTVWEPATGGTLAGNTPVSDGSCPEGTTYVDAINLPGGGQMDLCQLQRRYDSSDIK